ncbi:MAG: hypothetical protein IH947_05105 [Bacteroidetes bacterium]|nr:hypothetical protein [Bacteroidota bacterium]MCH8232865.1 hypothetical protein [Bacteroidota bacterium]
MNQVKIILMDWIGYPLQRRRRMGRKKHVCGLGPLLENLQAYEPGIGFDLMLIINSVLSESKPIFRRFPALIKQRQWQVKRRKARYEKLKQQYPIVSTLIFRESNMGKDIGAYDFGFNELKKQGYEGDVVFMNSNVRGPSSDDWLKKYHHLFHRQENVGLCGITMNSHNTPRKSDPFAPHIQSFFLYGNMKIFRYVFPDGFPGALWMGDKDLLIEKGEICISSAILDAGYSICCRAFPNFYYHKGGLWDIPEGDLRNKPEFQEFVNKL